MPHRSRCRHPAAALAVALVASAIASLSATVSSAAAASPRVMEFSVDGGTWSATSTKVDSSVLPAPTPLSIMGATALFGVSAEGHLVESSPDPGGSGQWLTTDLTSTATVPTLQGTVSVLVDRDNRVEVVARSSSDHVVTVRSSPDPTGWSVTDLSASVGAPLIMSNPSATLGSHGGVNIFYRTAASHLVGLIQHRRFSSGWWVRDLTKTTGGPDVRGTPSAVTTPIDGASVSVAVRSSSGDLLLLADDNARLTVWTSYDLSAETSSGTFRSSPTAVRAFGRLAVSAVRADGSLLTLSAPKASSHQFVAADLTAAAGTAGVEADTPSSAVIDGQLEIAARTPDRHLVVYRADPGSSYRAVTATDVSSAAAGIQITSAPAIVNRAGSSAVYAARYVSPPPPPPPPPTLASQIVAIAKGQDQTAAAVAETPMGSNCNPYTAHFGRGQTTGCPAGTAAEAWCSDFATWDWQAAGAQIGGLSGWSYSFADYGRAHGTWKLGATNNPLPGDAVVFGDESTHYGSHVGIVVAVRADGEIKMTSGNWSDAVFTTGFFDPRGPSGARYPIIGYTSPVAVGAASPHLASGSETISSVTQAEINTQDLGH